MPYSTTLVIKEDAEAFELWTGPVASEFSTSNFEGVKSDSGKDLPNSTYYYVIDKNNGSDRLTGFLLLRR